MVHVPWHPEEATAEIHAGDSVREVHGVESVELVSVGIDIGTTTSHLTFSRLLARRDGDEYSSSFRIDEREIVYRSPVVLTPYTDSGPIDTERLDALVREWFEEAGYTRDDVDAGAVIVTGEAARKENAEAIADLFAEQAGRFVCATAGANLEALMSAHGSGAVDYAVNEDEDILHVDIGGGTTKIALISSGFIEETASINVGARLIAVDDEDRITRLEDAAIRVADDVGVDLSYGDELTSKGRRQIAERFAELLFELVSGQLSPLARDLMVTAVPDLDGREFDALTFAGGGSEYVYDRDPDYYNDLGPEFGAAIRDEIDRRGHEIVELETGIRATAIGSTQHSVQVSGNTITVTTDANLPLRNVPMVPFVADHDDDPAALTRTIHEKLDRYDVDQRDGPFAFGFHTHGLPTADFVETIGDAVIDGWSAFGDDNPLILVFESDIAMNVGTYVADRIDRPVIAVDGAELDQFGYVDIGEPLEDTNAVPLTVKSLVFEG